MSDEPKTEKPAAAPEAIDPKEVRAQLGLPENAPDADVIAASCESSAAWHSFPRSLRARSGVPPAGCGCRNRRESASASAGEGLGWMTGLEPATLRATT